MKSKYCYQYRGAMIKGTGRLNSQCEYTAYLEHPSIKGVSVFFGKTWEQATQVAETALDELISSWN